MALPQGFSRARANPIVTKPATLSPTTKIKQPRRAGQRALGDRDGYVLTTKRLERGHFRVPWRSETGHVTVEAAELLLVLEGLDLSRVTRRPRWTPTANPSPSRGEEKDLDAGI